MRSKGRISTLDLYLAGAMRSSTDLARRLRQHDVTPRMLAEVREILSQTVLHDPARVNREVVEELFGLPHDDGPDRLTYQLNLWPEHWYDWHLSSSGIASHRGFRLIEDSTKPLWRPPNLEGVVEAFSLFKDTANEVKSVMGEPDHEASWGSSWSWHYGPSTDDLDLVFDLDFGLLQEIRQEKSSVKERTRDPWASPDEDRF